MRIDELNKEIIWKLWFNPEGLTIYKLAKLIGEVQQKISYRVKALTKAGWLIHLKGTRYKLNNENVKISEDGRILGLRTGNGWFFLWADGVELDTFFEFLAKNFSQEKV